MDERRNTAPEKQVEEAETISEINRDEFSKHEADKLREDTGRLRKRSRGFPKGKERNHSGIRIPEDMEHTVLKIGIIEGETNCEKNNSSDRVVDHSAFADGLQEIYFKL